jgi:molybdate transport system substrate-binding protein
MATREVLADLVALYREATGLAVQSEAAGGVDVAQRVRAGEAVDLVILASPAVDALTADGRLLPGSRRDLVRSGIAVAVRAGGDRPDIGSEEAVKRAVEAARTVSFSTGPSGVYLERLFERWGILEQLRARIVVPPPGVPVGRLVASGAAQLGFQQRSELSTVPGIEILGPLPPALQSITIFSGGVAAASGQAESARALLAFMASPAVAELKRRHGLEAA